MSPSPPRRIRFVDRIGRPGWFVATGVLLGLSFPPFPFAPLALVAFVPLLARWSRQPAIGMLFRETYSAFLIFAAFSGYWVLFHSTMLKALMLGLGVMLIPVLMSVPVIFSSLIARRFGKPIGIVTFVCSWLTLELVLTYGPIPVPWLLLGHTQADALLFNQFADVLGVGGLSVWVIGVNLLIFGLLEARTLTPRFAMSLGLVGMLVAPLSYGAWRVATLPPATETLRVALVQPVLPSSDWEALARAERVQILADLADERLNLLDPEQRRNPARPDLIVWPEGALPVFPDARLQGTLYSRVSQWSARRQVPLLAGAITRFDTAPALTVAPHLAEASAQSRPYYNSALLFDGHQHTQQYDKIHMLPVADHVPLPGWDPDQRTSVGTSFGIGGGRTLFRAAGSRFSALIAHEVVFGDHARRMVLDGAEFIAVLSNPSSWVFPPAHQQLEAMARLRAIENRRAVIIASVSGGSGMMLPDGSRAARADWGDRTVLTVDVPRHQALATYSAAGDTLYRIGTFATLLIGLAYGIAIMFFPTVRAGGSHEEDDPFAWARFLD